MAKECCLYTHQRYAVFTTRE